MIWLAVNLRLEGNTSLARIDYFRCLDAFGYA